VTKLIRAAVIGLGVGEQHARAWARCRGGRLAGICDRDKGKALRLSRELKTGTFGDWRQMLMEPALHAVSIATFDGQHARQVWDALRSGKHVFVEKPLCRTAAELKKIRKAWVRKKPGLMTNLVLRAAPLYRGIQRMIEIGRLGKIYAMDGDYLYGRIHKITGGWRSRDRTYSVMAGGGVHLLDLILGIAGEQPVSVSAVGNRICTHGSRFRRKDFVSAVFQFPSGLIARLTANFGCMNRHQHSLRIFGTRGTIFVDDVGARWHRSRRPDAKPILLKANRLPSSKGALIPHFVSLIRAGGGARKKAAEREFSLAACLIAADQALKTGAQQRIHE
jgi:predicted dehydrogenase